MNGFGGFNGQNPGMNNTYQHPGGYPQPQLYGQYVPFVQNTQMLQQPSNWSGAPAGYVGSQAGDIGPFSHHREPSPASSRSSDRRSSFKKMAQKEEEKEPRSNAALSACVDSLLARVLKIERALVKVEKKVKRRAEEDGVEQPAAKVAKVEPTDQKFQFRVVKGRIEAEEKGKFVVLGHQNVNFRVVNDQVETKVIFHCQISELKIPVDRITVDGMTTDLETIKKLQDKIMLVTLLRFTPDQGTPVPVVKTADISSEEPPSPDELIERFRANKLEPISIRKGSFIILSSNYIKLYQKIDGKIRVFEVSNKIIASRFRPGCFVRCTDLAKNPQSEVHFKLHRVLLHDEIIYYVSDVWEHKLRPDFEANYDLRCPNLEDTIVQPAEFRIVSPTALSATCEVNGEKLSFEVPSERVKAGKSYFKNLLEMKDFLTKYCYIYLRKTKKEGQGSYKAVLVLLKATMLPELKARKRSSAKEQIIPDGPDETTDVDSYTVVDEVHDEAEDAARKEVSDEVENAATEHGEKEEKRSEENIPLERTDNAVGSVVRDELSAIFLPVSATEGYIHWENEVFPIKPSDLWQEEVAFTTFQGLCTSPAHCRIAVVKEVDGHTRKELIVASLGELPSPDSIMRTIRGQSGILKFVTQDGKESMVISLDYKEYPISLGQVYLSGRKMQNIEDVKEYYTRKLTVLSEPAGHILVAFHPTRPDVTLKAERCLIDASPGPRGTQVSVLTGRYKGVNFVSSDDEFKEMSDFCIVDCDILLSETNSFVLGDFNMLQTTRNTNCLARQDPRVLLSRKFSGQIKKNVKCFLGEHPEFKLPRSTSATVVGMKIVNRLVEKLDAALNKSLTEVLGVGLRECFPDMGDDMAKMFLDEYRENGVITVEPEAAGSRIHLLAIKQEPQ